jgi:hypothetical protein
MAHRWRAEHADRPGSAGGLPVDRAWLAAGFHGVAIDDIRCVAPEPPPGRGHRLPPSTRMMAAVV